MATTIITKNGSGAPLAGDLTAGELAVDLTNKRLYSKDSGGTVIELGTTPSGISGGTIDDTVIGGTTAAAGTFTTFTSTGIDDNATSTAITIDSSQNVSLSGDLTVDTDTLYVDSTNNRVGIGTTDPSVNLQLNSVSDATASLIATTNADATLNLLESGVGDVGASFVYDGGDNKLHIKTGNNPPVTRMTINRDDGNVGIGVTSISHKLQLPQVSGTSLSFSNDAAFTLDGESCAYYGLTYSAPTGKFNMVLSAYSDLVFATSATERMRINSSGAVTFTSDSIVQDDGTTGRLTFDRDTGRNRIMSTTTGFGAYQLLETRAGSFTWRIGSASAAMTLDSSGNLLVGITSTGVNARFRGRTAVANTTANAIYLDNSSGTLLHSIRADGLFSTGTATNSPYNFSTTGTVAYLNSSGQLGYLSSVRDSKLNIQGLDDISWLYQLNAVSFNYKVKDDNGEYTSEAEQETEYGLIAEEVEEVNSDLCFYNVDENGNQTLAGVTYRKLIPVLTKAIQEQQAMIETLQAQVAELQGAN
jgi:hypothetical protein